LRVAVDTNVLLYAEGIDDPVRQERARFWLAALTGGHDTILPVQVLAELAAVLLRKRRMSAVAVGEVLASYSATANVVATSPDTLGAALDLIAAHGLSFWDAVILATAAEAGCDLLLSEDMQDGFVWRGVTVANPFAAMPHPLLTAL
jgi:predicted nucleic acid-binding protein